ncbi:hypothetical protein [Vibrio kanaloae]|uniref:hypothetical protein n=1 Tax=Vibrio kanaloae TaxID=170673 RepID=UPI001F107A3D|nr:hypothetical protein [Vibrio kanaloae]
MAQTFSFLITAVADSIGLGSMLALALLLIAVNKARRSFEAKGLNSMDCRFVGLR